ncbi:membrane hypothetical protein [Candidatus Methanoperedens nitroreducens]|uniref:Alpha-(1->3)-arabinofuranosyltransferase N-terminal GT-C domain-containing protein n=1 Tax=Candidatus Methanoperedens nitratireducens TaxID=1392998 RepID=A0A284VKC9_9EURY|nr:membrane hypothetical protein [Candidatus Methanoperedens nitroreducens]
MKITRYLTILAIIFLSLTPVIWFKPGYLIGRGDNFPFWFNSLNTFYNDNFIWDSTNTGQLSEWLRYGIFGSLWYILQVNHIPPNAAQILFQILYLLGGCLSIYLLSTTIYENQKITAVIASIFYMFNFYRMNYSVYQEVSWNLVFLPLLLAFYVRIINNLKKNEKTAKNIIGFAIVSTIMSSFSSTNPTLLLSILIAFGIIFVYYIIVENGIRIKIIKNLASLSILCFLINIWWIIPFIISLISTKTTSEMGFTTSIIGYSSMHVRSSFLNLFWLNGMWWWTPYYVSYFDAYSNPALKLLVFIPALIAFLGLLFRNNYRKINTYFGSVVLVLMFLAKGLHPPLENINFFLYNYVPGSFAFREPFPKFYLILIIFLALLVGSSCNSIVNMIRKTEFKHKNAASNLFVTFIAISFMISTFPLITGQILDTGPPDFRFSFYFQIPDYWYQTSNYINNNIEDSRILITPDDDFYQMPYKWGYYGADVLPSRLITKPTLQQQYGYIINSNYKGIITVAYGGIRNNSVTEFNNMLALMNVRYIVQRNDIWWDWDSRNIISPGDIKSFFSSQKNIQLENSFGEIDVYRVSNITYLPHIYTASAQITVHTFDDFIRLLNSSSFTPEQQNIIISYQNQNKTFSERDYSIRPHIFFQKINPTKYKIKIESAHKPFYLIFSESYHPGWQAYINTDSMQCNPIALYGNLNVTECGHESKFFEIKDLTRLSGQTIPEESHLLINSYANAWYIDPQKIGVADNFTITLSFRPQSYFYIGVIISGFTFIGCAGYLVWDWRRKRDEMRSIGGRTLY